MKYVLYEGQNGDMLFTKEENVKLHPNLLDKFTNKQPTFSVEANSDDEAIKQLNSHMASRAQNK